jgi:hypothetical protein
MPTAFEIKEQSVTDTPLLVFDCVLPDGRTERWSTHRVTLGGVTYDPRVLQHSLLETQAASDQGIDGIPRVSLVLANADSHFSQIAREHGWKGARLSIAFVFYDLRNDVALTDRALLFQGICNPPDEIREATFRISAVNRMNLQRLLLPQVRIQRRCPWTFPNTTEQRVEAVDGGSNGKYSLYYRCGYSPDAPGGSGNLSQGTPFETCSYTRADCAARGMSARFGGIGFVPSAISVRSFGDKSWHQSAVSLNQARYNDFVPLVYGTAWYAPPVVFARNDGNLTRMEVLLGTGELQGVLKVLVNDSDIPVGVSGANMTGTGWWILMTSGTRNGVGNPDFADANGTPAGDPYGSMAYLSIAVPNRLNDGTSLPRVKVLVQGAKVPTYSTDGTNAGEVFSSNPAWILLDILRRMGWAQSEIDVSSFATAAAECDQQVPAFDIYGNPIQLPRFGCNLLVQSRRSAGDLVRGVRNAGRLMLTYGLNGQLRASIEGTLAKEQASKPAHSNSREALNGGWPSYEFGDGSNGFSGILRRPDNEPSMRVFSRSMADSPNRMTVEFQDELNEYQQDSFSVVDADDVARVVQEVAAPLAALGIPNFDQAARLLKLSLDKSVRGNMYVEFDTSVKGFGIRPGDIITLTYLKEGLVRQPFRVLKLAPGLNHRTLTITAQQHDDAWYVDTNGQPTSATGGRRQGIASTGLPNPLMGSLLDANGDVQFTVEEEVSPATYSEGQSRISVTFIPPAVAHANGPPIPLISLAPQVVPGGIFQNGQVLYYAVSALDQAGNESGLSFIVRAVIAGSDSSVVLNGLSFGPGTSSFCVYRGVSPAQLFRIAANLLPVPEVIDNGIPKQLLAPPDPNYSHANFYWRMELQPESPSTTHTGTTIGNSTLEMPPNRYRSMTVRIARGRGAGQERAIISNTATTLTVAPPWDCPPDSSSSFVIAENGWKFGALAKTSPVQFEIPNRPGEVIHISGRAANISDAECPAELSIVTRWHIGGNGVDGGAPGRPFFGLGTLPRGGGLELSGISFTDLANTQSISAATLTLNYWNELLGIPAQRLATPVGATDLFITLSEPGATGPGGHLQLDRELLRVEEVLGGGMQYRVTRALNGSQAASHDTTSPIYDLARHTVIAPFPLEFFGSPYSGSWSYPVTLPSARVSSAELFVTNRFGPSPTCALALTNNDDFGLRTLSGGQYTLQVLGYLAVDASATPPLIVESPKTVRDVSAVLGSAADHDVWLQVNVNDSPYCAFNIPAGLKLCEPVSGRALPPLPSGARLTLSVRAVGVSSPGADLTVLIRL